MINTFDFWKKKQWRETVDAPAIMTDENGVLHRECVETAVNDSHRTCDE